MRREREFQIRRELHKKSDVRVHMHSGSERLHRERKTLRIECGHISDEKAATFSAHVESEAIAGNLFFSPHDGLVVVFKLEHSRGHMTLLENPMHGIVFLPRI